jgi:TonB-linked SusC/RagA family outer membrane protein
MKNFYSRFFLLERKTNHKTSLITKFAILLTLLTTLNVSAVVTTATAKQTNSINGLVTDGSTNEPLIGVNITVRATTRGVVTDANGKFTLDVAPGETLVVSYVGYLSEEVVVGDQKNITVKLMPDVQKLDEVVVIGYGTVKKKDLTGSVGSVKSDDITKTASSNAIQSMQARMPGVDIQQKDGQSGAALNIQLRGSRSLSASNDPLIMVDGVEYGSTLDLNPSDIESMDVLKDASSTAIYGTKGANGVILITTKRGKAGKAVVNFSTYFSSNSPANYPKVMYGDKEVQRLVDGANYLADYKTGNYGASDLSASDLLTLSLADGTSQYSIYEDGSYTDWAKLILKNGQTNNYELSVSGGNESTTYNLSLGYMKEGGLMRKDDLSRYNGKINIDQKISKIIKAGGSILYTYKDHDARNSGVFNQYLKMTTITHAYLADGTINVKPNPLYDAHCSPLLDETDGVYQNNILSQRFFGNTYLEITPLKNLVFKSMIALDRSNTRTGYYIDGQSVERFQSPTNDYISNESEFTTKYVWDNTLNYSAKFGKHDVTVMMGSSTTKSVYEEGITFGTAGTEHYYTSAFYDLSKIGTPTTTSKFTEQAMLSYFGRLNYKFNEKYLLTATLRADGSSTLAEGHKWGYFPSLAAAWRVNEESFLSGTKDFLSNLKLRASWGVSGNAAVQPYSTLTTLGNNVVYYYLNGATIAGNIPSNMGNPNLKWETTKAYNFGIDFGIINDRVTGSVDYFISKTSDLLYFKSQPASSVYPSVIDNIGSTEGHGIEIALNTTVVKSKDFSWDINWSYSHITDKVDALGDGIQKNIVGTSGVAVGQPVKSFYDYQNQKCWYVGEYDGYIADWQTRHPGETPNYIANYGTPGTIKVKDANDDGKIDENDKMYYNQSPKYIAGMNNTFTYKNLSLSVQLFARVGGYMQYGLNNLVTYDGSNWGNVNYWTPTNQSAKFPTPAGKDATISGLYTPYASSLLYEKADYLKIKDITLSFNLPKSILGKVGIGQVKLYGSLKNYFTFSKIPNYDPERGGAVSFPLAKQMVFGLNLQF